MKNYLIFATGKPSDKSFKTDIINAVSNITETNFLKFKAQENFITIHFGTSLTTTKLKTYMDSKIKKKEILYFLIEKSTNFTSSLTDGDFKEFLTLDEIETAYDCSNINNNESDEDLTDKLHEECLNAIFESFFEKSESKQEYIEQVEQKIEDNNNVVSFNLDDILDKISAKGVNSLTEEEHKYLNNLSK